MCVRTEYADISLLQNKRTTRMPDSEANQRPRREALVPIVGTSRPPGLVAIPTVAAAPSAGLFVLNESKFHSGFLIEIAGAMLIVVDLEVGNRTPCSVIQHTIYRSLVIAEMLQLRLSATNKIGGNIERTIVASLLTAGPGVAGGHRDSFQEFHRHFGSRRDLCLDAIRKKSAKYSESTTDGSAGSCAFSSTCHCTNDRTCAGAASNKDGVAAG
jgi:hypothetical protein